MLDPHLETRSLIKGLIDAACIVLIYGESGCGKTFFTLDLALHVADGCEFFGRRTVKGRVVYVAAEAGRSIRNRVAAFADEKWGGSDIDFRAVVSPVDLCHPKTWDVGKLIATIGTVDLLIIDTVSRALAGGNENAPDDMGAFVNALDILRDRLGCSVIAVHHVGKDPSRGGRGHSLLHCAVDTEIEVERRDEVVSVATVTKQRDGPGGAEIAFRLRQVVLGQDQDGDDVTSCVVDSSDYVPEKKLKNTGLSPQVKSGLDVLHRVVAEKGKPMNWGGQGVLLEDWKASMAESKDFGDGAKFRNAWLRARSKLIETKHVTIDGAYVWPNQQDLYGVPF